MISSPPKFRSDLTVSQQQTAGRTFFVVKDPVCGEFFRFGEAEQFIARQLDGETPLEAVRKKTEEELGATIPTETLDAFIKNLEKTGLLETGETRTKKTGQRGWIRGSLLYLRFKLFDPAQLFDRLVRRVRFFFTPHFLVVSATLILLGAGITIANWNAFTQDLSRLYRLSAIPVLVVVMFLVVSAHEFAHGLTCKRFGGEVHEMGFMLIYFQPALYCNVSDAWLFPEKSKRLWVGFAGAYFELFLWALATLIWRLTDAETWINYVALIVMASSGVKTLLNFNPFIKLDGYYLLSDYLEIPNLRRKSFRYVGGLVKSLFGLKPTIAEEVSLGARRIYLMYGLVAMVGSLSLLGTVVVTAGGYLVEGRHPFAVLLPLGLVGMRSRRRFRKLFGKASASSDPFDDLDDFDSSSSDRLPEPVRSEPAQRVTANREPAREHRDGWRMDLFGTPRLVIANREPARSEPARPEPARPESSRPEPARLRPSKRRRTRTRRRWITWAAVAGVALGVLFFGQAELRVAGPFNILPRENADVRAKVEGILERIYVDEGDEVNEGQVIARLSDRDQRAELQKIESDLEAKRARLQLLLAGPRLEEIELARKAVETGSTKQQQALELYGQAKRTRDERLALTATTIKKNEERLQFAEKNLKMYQTLVEQGLGARKLLDEAAEPVAVRKRELEEARAERQVMVAEDLAEIRKEVAVTEKEVNEAEGRLRVLLAGTRREEIQALQAEIRRSEAEQTYLREQIDGAQVVSPATGIIATPSQQLKAMNRQLVKKGDLIAKVHDFKTVTAQIIIPEKEIAGVRVGQKVVIRARAHPNETFHGTVTSIATAAQGGSSGSGPVLAGVPSGSAASTDKTIVVTTQTDNRALLLKPEMTGQAKIFCGQRRVWDLVTRRVARTLKVEFWSWW
ncbi:MAG TPA: efflux RND transporter periplasmic adaptor subunit [Terriglobia bacterium]|nr:efflux RND transporter periplasmic adaptor subunit [Terriglobia bacterium]